MSTYVVSKSGVVHVPRCSATRKAGLLPWTEETQLPGDRKCHLCFPAVTIRRPARQTPADPDAGQRLQDETNHHH